MTRVYLFRGKAATGKSTYSRYFKEKYQIMTLSKDDLFDTCFMQGHSIDECNAFAYDQLVNLSNHAISTGVDVILDVGLSDASSLDRFLSRMELSSTELIMFLCDCTDEFVWAQRLESRLSQSLPNQFFTSYHQAKEHYQKSQIKLVEGEIYVDSAQPFEKVINDLMPYFN